MHYFLCPHFERDSRLCVFTFVSGLALQYDGFKIVHLGLEVFRNVEFEYRVPILA